MRYKRANQFLHLSVNINVTHLTVENVEQSKEARKDCTENVTRQHETSLMPQHVFRQMNPMRSITETK
jgi:hypothetical protein